jgi:hypothetical protein
MWWKATGAWAGGRERCDSACPGQEVETAWIYRAKGMNAAPRVLLATSVGRGRLRIGRTHAPSVFVLATPPMTKLGRVTSDAR